jgi:transcriptional regulator with XRE-family HTH domain
MTGRFRVVVKRMRQAAGLSQSELARRLGTTQSAIARWETGEVSPRLDTLERIAAACGLDAHIVWAETGDVDRSQIRRQLSLTPRQRLQALVDMLEVEESLHRARRIGPVSAAPSKASAAQDDETDWRDPVIEAYKKDIDRTLLRENLKLTFEQRLRQHQQLAQFAAKFRGVARTHA